MPIYMYRCELGHEYERRQSFSASPVEVCPTCSTEARRKLFSPAVIYKGSGFYTTDYARKNLAPAGEAAQSQDSSSGNTGGDDHGQSHSTNGKVETSDNA